MTRNTAQGPGYDQLDLRFTRLFFLPDPLGSKPKECAQIEINLDAFNALNRTNFS